jgi:hypothetical protein
VIEPVEASVLSIEDLRELLLEQLAKEFPPPRLEGQTIAMQTLGILRPGHDLRRLHIMEWINLDTKVARLILAHEITHALQDQHFGLHESPLRSRDNDDAALAALTVIEGDAMVTMGEYAAHMADVTLLFEALQFLGMDQSALIQSPPFIQAQLLFPYLTGQTFVMRARTGPRGTESVNDLLTRWPESTEQILHPERLPRAGGGDHPTPVTIEPAEWGVPAEWELRASNVWGELGVRQIFQGSLTARRAAEVAEGWDGDRWGVWRDPEGGQSAYLWSTVWDSETDAEAFQAALSRLWPRVTFGEIVDPQGEPAYRYPKVAICRVGATVHLCVWDRTGGVEITPPAQRINRVD